MAVLESWNRCNAEVERSLAVSEEDWNGSNAELVGKC